MDATRSERRWQDNGKAIARARRRQGISQEKLALAVNTTRRHMIRLENGEHLPSGTLRDRIAEALDVSNDEIQSVDDQDDDSDPLNKATVNDLLHELLLRVGLSESVFTKEVHA